MTIVVNGQAQDLPHGAVIVDIVAQIVRSDATGVAVARNGEVVRRKEWPDVGLADGDTVEILQAVAGG